MRLTWILYAVTGTLAPEAGRSDRAPARLGASMIAMHRREKMGYRMAISRSLRAVAFPIFISCILVAAATVCLMVARQFFDLSLITLIYLIPVMIAATRWGIVPALTTAIASAATADFFFTEPYYSLWISDPRQVVDLLLFLIVAVVTGDLAARLRKEADTSRRQEMEVRDLYAFSRRLAACYTTSDLYSAIQDFIANHLGRQAALIGAATGSERTSLRDIAIPDRVSYRAREILAGGEFQSQLVVDAATQDVWLVRPLSSDANEYGVIVVNLGSNAHDNVEASRHRIELLLADVTETLNRLNISKTIRSAKLRTEADLLKDVLIGSVSHELRTPLASILGSASVLVDVPEIQRNDNLSALAQATHEEAARLSGLVQKLLHATRITADRARSQHAWVDPTDIVNAAIAQRSYRLALHKLDVELAPDLPLVEVDAMLIEQAFGELLENAAKYSPAGSTIRVTARGEDQRVVLSVCDQGAGLTSSEKSQLFGRSFRGERHLASVVGSGLGLWMAHTFVVASGGTLNAVSQGEGLGTAISIHLPADFEAVPELADQAYE
jgi:K+-sensing histidine kinase KdpD